MENDNIQQLKEENLLLQKQIKALQNEIIKLNKEIEFMENDFEAQRALDTKERIKFNEKLFEIEQETTNQLKQSKVFYEEEIERISNDRGRLRKELEDVKQELEKLKSDYNQIERNFHEHKRDSQIRSEQDKAQNLAHKDEINRLNSIINENTKKYHQGLKDSQIQKESWIFQANKYCEEAKKLNDELTEAKNHLKKYIIRKLELEEVVLMQRQYLYELKTYFEKDIKHICDFNCDYSREHKKISIELQKTIDFSDKFELDKIKFEENKTKSTREVHKSLKAHKYLNLQRKLSKCERKIADVELKRKQMKLNKNNNNNDKVILN